MSEKGIRALKKDEKILKDLKIKIGEFLKIQNLYKDRITVPKNIKVVLPKQNFTGKYNYSSKLKIIFSRIF